MALQLYLFRNGDAYRVPRHIKINQQNLSDGKVFKKGETDDAITFLKQT